MRKYQSDRKLGAPPRKELAVWLQGVRRTVSKWKQPLASQAQLERSRTRNSRAAQSDPAWER